MKLIDYLEQHACASPDKLFVTQPDGTQMSYAQFWQAVCTEAEQICQQRRPHEALVIRTTQTIGYLVQYFACHRAEVVVVPVEHDLPADKLHDIEAQVAGITFPAEASDILFTTGTTGAPKGVVLSHKALLADAENLTRAHGFHRDLTFIINGPLNHFGSHSKVLPVVRNGGSLYLMEGMKSLEDFFVALDKTSGRVATFLVPASIRMLIQFSAERLHSYASRFEFIETGAAPITQTDMRRLAELLPDSRLFNTYAGSEMGVICTYNFNDGQAFQGCVGPTFPLSRVELRDGVVVCASQGAMMGYLGQPLVETVSEIETSDLGRLDDSGRLFLIGRANDIINVGGLKVSPVEVEEVAAAVIEGLKDCICIAQSHPVMGSVPKLLVVMQEGVTLDKRAVAKLMRTRLESYKLPVNIEIVDHVERTYNGKINRKFYQKPL